MWFYLLSLLWFQYCSSAFPCWDITALWFWDSLMVLCFYHCDFLVCVFLLLFPVLLGSLQLLVSWVLLLPRDCLDYVHYVPFGYHFLSQPSLPLFALLVFCCSSNAPCVCLLYSCAWVVCVIVEPLHSFSFCFVLWTLVFFYFKLSSLFVLSLYILKPLLWHKFSISRVSFCINFWINLP